MKKCIITVYYSIDNLCKIYQESGKKRLIPSNNQRNRDRKFPLAELLTISDIFLFVTMQGF
ncbi:putative transposase [Orientia tsutsugamushi str. Kato PP]|uniref:Transposase n=1 Tax=Orientia tsutsugamushi TaxID=784 RepID=A0A2U3RFJ1_ORITS|nr:putative transposase [Orientia tsutsugamushi str. Kato PP]SPR11967.1 transposase [Orientia tsutsugamushi]